MANDNTAIPADISIGGSETGPTRTEQVNHSLRAELAETKLELTRALYIISSLEEDTNTRGTNAIRKYYEKISHHLNPISYSTTIADIESNSPRLLNTLQRDIQISQYHNTAEHIVDRASTARELDDLYEEYFRLLDATSNLPPIHSEHL